MFLAGNSANIGLQDFVYVIQVKNMSPQGIAIGEVSVGACGNSLGGNGAVISCGSNITSIGFCPTTGSMVKNPSSANSPPDQDGVDYNFPGARLIQSGEKTSLLFYTSPDPPKLTTAGIIGAGAVSGGDKQIYGSCPTSIKLDKKIACGTGGTPGTFTDGPLQTLAGEQIFYQITIENTGQTQLVNVVVKDLQLGPLVGHPDGNLSNDFFGAPQGTLDPGQVMFAVFGPTTATTDFTNTAMVNGVYNIPPDPLGNAGTFAVTSSDSVTLDVVNPTIQCDKQVNGVKNLPNYILGQMLTYTLSVTNPASSEVPLKITVDDPKLSSLTPISCTLEDSTPVTLPHMFASVPPGTTRTITCKKTFATFAEFKAAGIMMPDGSVTLNNTMMVSATPTQGASICGAANLTLTCTSGASVTVQPPRLTLTKEVACFSPSLDCNSGAFQTTTPANPLKVLRSQDGSMTAAVVYRYLVKNTGGAPINSITIMDDQLGVFPVPNLAPNAMSSFICTGPITPTAAPGVVLTNTAKAVGTSAGSSTANDVTSDPATASVVVQQASLTCSLTASDCPTGSNPVTFTLKLTNGLVPVTVNSITLTGFPPGPPLPPPPFNLAPGEMKTFTLTFTPPSGTIEFKTKVIAAVTSSIGLCTGKADGTSVSTQVMTECSTTPCVKCSTICFLSAKYWSLHLDHLPGGTVVVGGVNMNAGISTSNTSVIGIALKGGPAPLQQLNQQFVAAQLNLIIGSGGGGVATNVLWTNLLCYGGFFSNFPPVTLSNGVTITPSSMLKDLFMQAQAAIRDNRTADMVLLAGLFAKLNGNSPLGFCGTTKF